MTIDNFKFPFLFCQGHWFKVTERSSHTRTRSIRSPNSFIFHIKIKCGETIMDHVFFFWNFKSNRETSINLNTFITLYWFGLCGEEGGRAYLGAVIYLLFISQNNR